MRAVDIPAVYTATTTSSISEPCTYTIPPELDVNTYIARAMSAVTSITDVTTKTVALIRLNNMEADIRAVVNK